MVNERKCSDISLLVQFTISANKNDIHVEMRSYFCLLLCEIKDPQFWTLPWISSCKCATVITVSCVCAGLNREGKLQCTGLSCCSPTNNQPKYNCHEVCVLKTKTSCCHVHNTCASDLKTIQLIFILPEAVMIAVNWDGIFFFDYSSLFCIFKIFLCFFSYSFSFFPHPDFFFYFCRPQRIYFSTYIYFFSVSSSFEFNHMRFLCVISNVWIYSFIFILPHSKVVNSQRYTGGHTHIALSLLFTVRQRAQNTCNLRKSLSLLI